MAEVRSPGPQAGLEAFLDSALPRILTQVDRDPTSPTYGSFDRNAWHYKIRDFPSIILQQGGYALHEAGRVPHWHRHAAAFDAIAAAGVRYWNERAVRSGAFEEYYPWEQGYPPLAFSTLAVAKLISDGVEDPTSVAAGAKVAAGQLLARFESQAANQQVAGLAALACLRKIFPGLVDGAAFDPIRDRTLALQTDEGWFVEYDGPDLGYLSVTLDCLWDLWDATRDSRYLESIRLAVGFMEPLVEIAGGSIGMHNARNTDYVVPYGLLRSAVDPEMSSIPAARMFQVLFSDVTAPTHFLRAVDDRYLTHYIGHSVARAAQLESPRVDLSDASPASEDRFIDRAGYGLYRSGAVSALVSGRKGGALSARWPGGRLSDLGWTVQTDTALLVSHWWNADWKIERIGTGQYAVEGRLVPHRHQTNSPLRHILLRVASRVLGRRLIGLLKRRLIFNTGRSKVRLRREITVGSREIEVVDRFSNLSPSDQPVRSPRASKRHVASADSFHKEDLELLDGVIRDEKISRSGADITVTTIYRPSPASDEPEPSA
jgi:hypothetical protein